MHCFVLSCGRRPHNRAKAGENIRPEVAWQPMDLKHEALKLIRERVGNRSIGPATLLTALTEAYDTSLEELVEALEAEFGVELSDELLVEVETVGELCSLVARAEE